MATSSKNTPTTAGQTASDATRNSVVEAINQMFAEFELMFPNQYHKAFATEEKLKYAKQLWFGHLRDYTREQIIDAVHRAVRSSDFLPSVHSVISMIENNLAGYGLPPSREAYYEACKAPQPKTGYAWSHPAVYHAGQQCDWFFLSTASEAEGFPVFDKYYRQLCQRVIRGEIFTVPTVTALPDSAGPDLSHEEQLARLGELRHKLGL